MPLWEAHTRGGEVLVVGTPWRDAGEKDAAAAELRDLFREKDVVAYVSIFESWLRKGGPDDPITEADHERMTRHGVRADPKRVEALVYTAEDGTGMLMACQTIERRLGRKKPRLAPLEFWDRLDMEGRFTGMLPRDGSLQ
jgi:hypothetical protein